MRALPWTLAMFGLGLGTAFFVGTRVGRWAGWRKSSTTPTTLGAATLTSLFPPWVVFLAFYTTLNLFGFRFFNRMTALNFELWDDGRDEGATLWTMIGIVIALVAVVQMVGRDHQGSTISEDLEMVRSSGYPPGGLLDLGVSRHPRARD